MSDTLISKSKNYLDTFCVKITERCVGSEGNRQATQFFEETIGTLGWETKATAFDAIDWNEKGANLRAEGTGFEVLVSPYSHGFSGEAELVVAGTFSELEELSMTGKIVMLYNELAKEQLMPKNFVFYNPERHQQIISLLEKGRPEAIIAATGRNSELAGGIYPFPLIEDGDFNIPSVYMTEEEGRKLLPMAGKRVFLESFSERIPGKGYNVVASKSSDKARRIVVTAHIDAKKGTPGAIDNATGVIVLLLLAELLKDYDGDKRIDLVAFNGEDYYAVPGQMSYISEYQDIFGTIMLNINIDGAGYKEGPSALSLFDLPEPILTASRKIIAHFPGLSEGALWPQGDHSIFLQFGIPAIAVSSGWFVEHVNEQDITHTPKDNPGIVDCARLPEIATALNELIRSL
jgi:aminopeptidase YwaD